MNDIQTLMRSANPIPDARQEFTETDVKTLLTLTLTRSGEMDVKEIVTPVEPDKPRWNGWLVAAASFGVVVLVAGLALLLTRSSTEELPPASTPTTATFAETTIVEDDVTPTTAAVPVVSSGDIAAVQAFLAAMSAGDEEALRASIGPAFGYSGLIGDTVFDLEAVLSWSGGLAAQETTITADTCRPSESGLACDESHAGPVESTFGVPVLWNVQYEIVDGLIASAAATGCNCFLWGDVQKEIRGWVRTFAPDQADLMTSYPVFPDAAAGAAFLKYAPMWESFEGDAEAAVALGVIRAYEAAVNAANVETFDTLLAPDMEISRDFDSNTVSRDGWVNLPERLLARDAVLGIEDCRPEGADIECNVYRSGPIANAIYFFPMRDKQTFTVADGEVQHIHVVAQVWENPSDMGPVADWVATIDAGAGRIMSQTMSFQDGSPESDALWLKYAPLWSEAGRP